jgi:hypothetical protein
MLLNGVVNNPMSIDDYQPNEAELPIGLGKDWAMVRTMAQYVKNTPQKNITPVVIENVTRKTKLSLIMMPEWGVYFPPYNLSRLSAVTRAAGFKTTVFDINVKSYHLLKDKLDFDPWDSNREWMWVGDWYTKELHPHLDNLFKTYARMIIRNKPDVVGFSMYYTNEQATNWMANYIKWCLPDCKIIVGGPQAQSMRESSKEIYDHIIEGEGEQVLIDLLTKVENDQPINEKFLQKNSKLRLDLDSLPFPDYSDFNFDEYTIKGGFSAEISRGCVAKCVFCTEVHFWKYRDRMSGSLLN